MSGGDPHWSEPKWVRASVRHAGNHIGSITTVSYPNRDLTAFPEGSPYFEVVIADLSERHVALLQRFRQHWLIHCGDTYETTRVSGELSPEEIFELAAFALLHRIDPPPVLASALGLQVEGLLAPREKPTEVQRSKVNTPRAIRAHPPYRQKP
jgi:hypothetical protein